MVNQDPLQDNVEPSWRVAENFSNTMLPSEERDWLLDDTSLTDRLINFYEGIFSVTRLSQSWELPLQSEIAILKTKANEKALVRKVILCLDERPVVFARSIIPKTSLEGSLSHLQDLGNKSLGAILFDTPGILRNPFEIALIPGDHPYLPKSFFQPNSVWGRRSCFSLALKNIIVSEVFLDDFEPWTQKKIKRSESFKALTVFAQATGN